VRAGSRAHPCTALLRAALVPGANPAEGDRYVRRPGDALVEASALKNVTGPLPLNIVEQVALLSTCGA
jgi:hypothetical protein